MNDAPLFEIVSADAGVQALFGTNPCRVFPFGDTRIQGDKVTKPYAVFQLAGGTPENNLSDRPKSDFVDIQIDVYGKTVATTKAAQKAIEEAIELDCHIVRLLSAAIEPDTKLYRSSFQTQWNVKREP